MLSERGALTNELLYAVRTVERSDLLYLNATWRMWPDGLRDRVYLCVVDHTRR